MPELRTRIKEPSPALLVLSVVRKHMIQIRPSFPSCSPISSLADAETSKHTPRPMEREDVTLHEDGSKGNNRNDPKEVEACKSRQNAKQSADLETEERKRGHAMRDIKRSRGRYNRTAITPRDAFFPAQDAVKCLLER
ncbi:hypothetical protein K402DRAFT_73724 [Aulographum hederae CBS 113979]|uniref:Uncharacterized protein n=1 Tax=Aulographum hederae CBS 113979 TaxID=1176131 RepID=A0A6G1HFJ0_9PEZI|nr:hypothetical protein K402DRAFT_73724 [Aulographum hederae CBS 113979]